MQKQIIKQKESKGIAPRLVNPIENLSLQRKPARTKLWQLDHNYHCAVIGTCLTLDEVKNLLKQLHIECRKSSSYDIHTTIVTMIASNDFRSKKVQSYLDKKFKVMIQNTRKMNADELKMEWKKVLNNGNIIGIFWAVMSHPSTDSEMKRDFYGDVHMLSHLSGASNRADLKRLNLLEKLFKETNSQQAKYEKLKAEHFRLQTTVSQQEEKVCDLINQVEALQNANEHLMIINGEAVCQQLNFQIEKLNNKIGFQEDEIKKYHDKADQLVAVVSQQEKQINIYETTITTYKKETEHLQNILEQQRNNENCRFKQKDLCGQCVLYVGGKANLVPHYRELVETKSGVFLYHDGGIEKNTQDLSETLKRADLVVFPSDCISHDAFWRIKRICKKLHKPYQYLKSPGLYSLSRVLEIFIEKNETVME